MFELNLKCKVLLSPEDYDVIIVAATPHQQHTCQSYIPVHCHYEKSP